MLCYNSVEKFWLCHIINVSGKPCHGRCPPRIFRWPRSEHSSPGRTVGTVKPCLHWLKFTLLFYNFLIMKDFLECSKLEASFFQSLQFKWDCLIIKRSWTKLHTFDTLSQCKQLNLTCAWIMACRWRCTIPCPTGCTEFLSLFSCRPFLACKVWVVRWRGAIAINVIRRIPLNPLRPENNLNP